MVLVRAVYAFFKNLDGFVFPLTLEVFHKYYCIKKVPTVSGGREVNTFQRA